MEPYGKSEVGSDFREALQQGVAFGGGKAVEEGALRKFYANSAS